MREHAPQLWPDGGPGAAACSVPVVPPTLQPSQHLLPSVVCNVLSAHPSLRPGLLSQIVEWDKVRRDKQQQHQTSTTLAQQVPFCQGHKFTGLHTAAIPVNPSLASEAGTGAECPNGDGSVCEAPIVASISWHQ